MTVRGELVELFSLYTLWGSGIEPRLLSGRCLYQMSHLPHPPPLFNIALINFKLCVC